MTDIELFREALLDLEWYRAKYGGDNLAGETIEALRTRLAEAEKFCDSHCTWSDHHPDCDMAGADG